MSCGGQQVKLPFIPLSALCLCCRAAGCRSSWSGSGAAPKSHFLSAAWQVASSGKHCILSTTTGTAHTVTFQTCWLPLTAQQSTHWECLTHRLCKKKSTKEQFVQHRSYISSVSLLVLSALPRVDKQVTRHTTTTTLNAKRRSKRDTAWPLCEWQPTCSPMQRGDLSYPWKMPLFHCDISLLQLKNHLQPTTLI